MTTVRVPAALAEVLQNTGGPAALVTEDGRLLGSFSPAAAIPDELSPEELAVLKKRMTSPGPWLTTEQVIAHIEARGTP